MEGTKPQIRPWVRRESATLRHPYGFVTVMTKGRWNDQGERVHYGNQVVEGPPQDFSRLLLVAGGHGGRFQSAAVAEATAIRDALEVVWRRGCRKSILNQMLRLLLI
ncbi:hypothetical protein ACFX19_038050 [Malus domestica]